MQKRTMLSKNDTVKSMKKNKIAKREWEGNDYSPITSEKDIERALREEYSWFDSLVKLEYVGTDWAMGSQYWVALFKKKGGNSEHLPYACVTVIDWTYDSPQRGIISDGYVDGELDEMESVYQHKVDRLKRGTRKSMMKSKGEEMKSKSVRKGKSINWNYKILNIGSVIREIENELYDTYWDNAPDRYWTEKESNLYHQIADGLDELEIAVNSYYDLLSNADYSASAKKSKSMRKGADSIAKVHSYYLNSISDLDPINSLYADAVELYKNYSNNIPDGYWDEKESDMFYAITDTLEKAEIKIGRYVEHMSNSEYSASTKKSKREILKAKVDELLEEEDDEIAKPRMKDMFLDSKRKSRKSTKSNDEKGEDADEYREESDGDDVSDSKVMKPEEANDNEDENEAPSGGNSSLPEDADGQENQSAKRKKRMSKFSVTTGGSQPYNGRQNYNQSPMMREAIDRFKAEKDLVKSLQNRVDEINGARKNTEVNNKSPLRIKGRY